MSLLRVISLTVLADSTCNILIFFAEKMWVAFKLLTFFQQKISVYLRISVNFNESLTSFEQLGSGYYGNRAISSEPIFTVYKGT